MFPTGVGMNRRALNEQGLVEGVPHGCGDEPALKNIAKAGTLCSPRVWG